MPEKLDPKEPASFKELLISNMLEIQTIAQLLIEKGIFSQEEYFGKLKQIQMDYESRKNV